MISAENDSQCENPFVYKSVPVLVVNENNCNVKKKPINAVSTVSLLKK